jgi:hypothetical protein
LYKTGTILVLKEQRGPEQKVDPISGAPKMKVRRNHKTGEVVETDKPDMQDFPYNRVMVCGQSPVRRGGEGWEGSDAVEVIIQPLSDFGGNLAEPFGKLKTIYDVESIPTDEVPREQVVKIIDRNSNEAGPTPEEVFADAAPGVPPAEGLKRGRTSPFDDVKPAPGTAGKSPL